MLAAERGLAVALHTPTEVKAAVTGYGRADKNQVTAMVTAILKLDTPPKPPDAADALALAICHAWRGGVSTLAGETAAQRAWRAALGTSRS
jgi:crossover junction endodeoxyribonuclease RuvC